uniref:Uncharacterized protein n=1 Tax=Arundo donax TaxID=35708 RepID=A0A0A9DZ26_ARUDO
MQPCLILYLFMEIYWMLEWSPASTGLIDPMRINHDDGIQMIAHLKHHEVSVWFIMSQSRVSCINLHSAIIHLLSACDALFTSPLELIMENLGVVPPRELPPLVYPVGCSRCLGDGPLSVSQLFISAAQCLLPYG